MVGWEQRRMGRAAVQNYDAFVRTCRETIDTPHGREVVVEAASVLRGKDRRDICCRLVRDEAGRPGRRRCEDA